MHDVYSPANKLMSVDNYVLCVILYVILITICNINVFNTSLIELLNVIFIKIRMFTHFVISILAYFNNI